MSPLVGSIRSMRSTLRPLATDVRLKGCLAGVVSSAPASAGALSACLPALSSPAREWCQNRNPATPNSATTNPLGSMPSRRPKTLFCAASLMAYLRRVRHCRENRLKTDGRVDLHTALLRRGLHRIDHQQHRRTVGFRKKSHQILIRTLKGRRHIEQLEIRRTFNRLFRKGRLPLLQPRHLTHALNLRNHVFIGQTLGQKVPRLKVSRFPAAKLHFLR